MSIPTLNDRINAIGFIKSGINSIEEVIESEVNKASYAAWGFRICTFVAMIISIIFIIYPLVKIFTFIPIIGETVFPFVVLVSVIISLLICTVSMSVMWLYYRPDVAMFIFVAVILIMYLTYLISKDKLYKRKLLGKSSLIIKRGLR